MDGQAAEIVDDRSFSHRVLEPQHATLVLFTARDCLPCNFLARGLPSLASDLKGAVDFIRCPIEASPRTAERYTVARTPTLLLFMGGGLIASRVGPAPLPVIRRWVMDALEGHLGVEMGREAPTRSFLRHVVSRPTVLRACGVASAAAPVLLLLNHTGLLLSNPLSYPVLRKLALNFVVPYLVSSYSSARAATDLGRHRGHSDDPPPSLGPAH